MAPSLVRRVEVVDGMPQRLLAVVDMSRIGRTHVGKAVVRGEKKGYQNLITNISTKVKEGEAHKVSLREDDVRSISEICAHHGYLLDYDADALFAYIVYGEGELIANPNGVQGGDGESAPNRKVFLKSLELDPQVNQDERKDFSVGGLAA